MISGGLISAVPIPVQSFQQEADGLRLAMQPGTMKLRVCEDGIIRVTYAPGAVLPATQDIAVIETWPSNPSFNVTSDAASVTMATSKLWVRVDLASGRLQFTDPGGNVLLEEPADGGKSMPVATVNGENSHAPQQSFLSPSGEALYGMGQFQEGLWNYRGIPLVLRQVNTHTSVPVLVSSRGYGLFWNNASLTDFNPADTELAIDSGTGAGTFTTGAAGEYVFQVRDGDLRADIGVSVNGSEVARITNYWVPHSVSGKITLPANTVCTVQRHGGGSGSKVFARPLGDRTVFRSEVGDAIDYYYFHGPSLDEVIAGYRRATGGQPMLPKWATGFWQCRERYASQQQILDTVAGFRARGIPLDLIVQDWQYWGNYGWGAYQWDPVNYPDPAAMISSLHGSNVKFMISVWSNPEGDVGNQLASMTPSGRLPGSTFMDVFSSAVRTVRWNAMNAAFFSIGTDAWWQDATEPEDENALLNKTVYLESTATSSNRLRLAYPLYASKAAYEGQRSTTSAKRVVNLTRSAYAGQQRYGTVLWSGDITGDWTTLRRQIPAGLNFSLTGQPWWTTDTAGFFRPSGQYTSPDFNELLTRWFQWSTFCPVQRIHGYQTNTELWNYLPDTQRRLTDFIKLRYRLQPYNYAVAWLTHDQGYTMMRALPMDFPNDTSLRGISDQYLFGPALMVSPITTPGATSREVRLPAGTTWLDFWTGESHTGGQTITTSASLDRIPLHVRAGSIIPIGPDQQWTGQITGAPVELRVYRGADGNFTLYDDAGDSYAYENGERALVPLTWDDATQTLHFGARQGSYPGMAAQTQFRIRWVAPGHAAGTPGDHQGDVNFTYDGTAASVTMPVLPLPAAPANPIATPAPGAITLDWGVVPEAASYRIERAPSESGPFTLLASEITATTYTDSGLAPFETWHYRISAINLSGTGPASVAVSAQSALSTPLVWNAPGGTWNTSAANWLNESNVPSFWPNTTGHRAVFGGVGAGIVDVDSGIITNGLTFSQTGYLLSGGPFTLGGGLPFVQTEADATISATITGSEGLLKTGSATLSLSGSNTFTGTARIQSGTLRLEGLAFATAARAYTIDSGAVLQMHGNMGFPGGASSISGNGEWRITGGTFGNESPNSPVGPGRGIAVGLGSGARIVIESGATMLNGGWQSHEWSANLADLTVDGAFDIWDGNPVRVDALDGNGSITKNHSGNSPTELRLGVDGGSGSFSGTIANPAGQIALVKEGSGTQTFTGSLIHTGDTTVAGGTLVLDSTGSLRFTLTPTGHNRITGTGTAEFHGSFTIDTSALSTPVPGTSWKLVDMASRIFGPAFHVAGFSPLGDGIHWIKPASALNQWVFSESTGTLALETADYPAWSNNAGLAGGPDGDDDSDGLSNHEEYVFGLDPKSGASSQPVTLADSGPEITLSYTRRNPSLTRLTYTVWFSTDLVDWQQDDGASQSVITTHGDEQTVGVSLSPSLYSEQRIFIQIRAN